MTKNFLKKDSVFARVCSYDFVSVLFCRTKQMACNLVTWVVLTDQWPYGISYILQMIEECSNINKGGDEIRDEDNLFDIFE